MDKIRPDIRVTPHSDVEVINVETDYFPPPTLPSALAADPRGVVAYFLRS